MSRMLSPGDGPYAGLNLEQESLDAHLLLRGAIVDRLPIIHRDRGEFAPFEFDVALRQTRWRLSSSRAYGRLGAIHRLVRRNQ